MIKKPCFRTLFNSQQARESHLLLKWQHFYHILLSVSEKWSSKKSLLVISEILWLVATKLQANGKYTLQHSEKLPEPIQMQISKKRQNFSDFFTPFLKSTSSFKHFEKKDDPHSLCISEITDCQRRDQINV